MTSRKPRRSFWRRQWRRILVLSVLAGAMWGVKVAEALAPHFDAMQYGIRASEQQGWTTVPLAPFLHADWPHLVSNSLPFFVLGFLVIVRSTWNFCCVTVVATAASGFGAWYYGEPGTVHLGASGLVFGFFGYVFSRAFFERTLLALGLAVLAGFLYGGLIWGLLPGTAGISWEGHICGFIGGLTCGYFLARRPKIRR